MRHVKHAKTDEEIARAAMEKKVESLNARSTMAQAEVANLQNVLSELKVSSFFLSKRNINASFVPIPFRHSWQKHRAPSQKPESETKSLITICS
jgi:hypothetical protein